MFNGRIGSGPRSPVCWPLGLVCFAFAISLATIALAEPVDDALVVCSDHGDDLELRAQEFRRLGWSEADHSGIALAAWADASMLSDAPDNNNPDEWSARHAQALSLAEAQDADHLLTREGAFVWLGTDRKTGHATCLLAAETSASGADLFSEAEALGTLRELSATYNGRISRLVRHENGNGWITVVSMSALGGRGEIPDFGRKLSASLTLAFITGPLEVAP
jgi:hypothetical protein